MIYLLEPSDGGTRVTLRHAGIVDPEAGSKVSTGWQTSLERLAELLSA